MMNLRIVQSWKHWLVQFETSEGWEELDRFKTLEEAEACVEIELAQ